MGLGAHPAGNCSHAWIPYRLLRGYARLAAPPDVHGLEGVLFLDGPSGQSIALFFDQLAIRHARFPGLAAARIQPSLDLRAMNQGFRRRAPHDWCCSGAPE